MAREEYNLPLTKEAYEQLRPKIEGVLIAKRRYCIPLEPYTIELDVFEGELDGMTLAEVEFPSMEEAEAFCPPEWFVKDVTFCWNITTVIWRCMVESQCPNKIVYDLKKNSRKSKHFFK